MSSLNQLCCRTFWHDGRRRDDFVSFSFPLPILWPRAHRVLHHHPRLPLSLTEAPRLHLQAAARAPRSLLRPTSPATGARRLSTAATGRIGNKRSGTSTSATWRNPPPARAPGEDTQSGGPAAWRGGRASRPLRRWLQLQKRPKR